MLTKFLFNVGQLMRQMGFDFKEIHNPAFFDMQKKLHELGGINFKIEYHPDGSWSAESINIDGIITNIGPKKYIGNFENMLSLLVNISFRMLGR